MIQELEWGGAHQMLLLFKSGVLGMLLGVPFEMISGVGRRRRRTWLFIADVLYCLFATLVTFFFSLSVNDGKLHPVMYIGLALGALIEHISVGRWIGRFTYRMAGGLHSLADFISAYMSRFLAKVGRIFKIDRKTAKKIKKTRKKRHFFQKKA